MLEVGGAGTHGVDKGVVPFLRDDEVVATVRASKWKESATAVVGDQEWVFDKARGTLVARGSTDPEGTQRLRARQTSFWRGTWEADLEGTPVRTEATSRWRNRHRYLVGDREIARSGDTGGWSPRPTLTAEESLPLDHQIFLLWLELVISRRDQAALTAALGAAAVGGSS